MSELHVEPSALRSIASTLRAGGADVEAVGADQPGRVDAGTMTGFVTAILGEVAAQSATLCEGLHDMATAVTREHDSFVGVDQHVAGDFARRGIG